MKKLLVISDSHDREGMLDLMADHIKNTDYHMIIHLGDVVYDVDWLVRHTGRQIIKVAGNNDIFSHEPVEYEAKIEDVRLLAVHGDRQRVKYGYDRLSYYAEERGCQVALFGHTHVAFASYVGNTLLINPGALKDGRYATVEIDGTRIVPKLLRL